MDIKKIMKISLISIGFITIIGSMLSTNALVSSMLLIGSVMISLALHLMPAHTVEIETPVIPQPLPITSVQESAKEKQIKELEQKLQAIREQKAAEPAPGYNCPVCNQLFTNQHKMQVHIIGKHKEYAMERLMAE